jgi:SAM-dependent methyltransferase
MIRKAIAIIKARGVLVFLRAAYSRVRGMLARQAKSFRAYKDQFIGKTGIEIGGPSPVFSKRGIFPVYPIVETLDNCNFDCTTVWEGAVNRGKTYRFDSKKPNGEQHIVDATAMDELPSSAYDFVLSSHMLEHTANPILALSEWRRLLKDDGTLVLVLPDKRHTFDHHRPVTTMEHLVADFNARMTEDDLTHVPEVLSLHDFARDPEAGDVASFKLRCMLNFENRCLHHHVFDAQLVTQLVKYVGLSVHEVEEVSPHHILLLARK